MCASPPQVALYVVLDAGQECGACRHTVADVRAELLTVMEAFAVPQYVLLRCVRNESAILNHA